MTNNINIKLPSGDIKSYPNKITPYDIAAEISISLKKNAIISKVNNELWDLDRSIDFDCDLEIITIVAEERENKPAHAQQGFFLKGGSAIIIDTKEFLGISKKFSK